VKQQVTRGIVLSRINYGEADRILTILTPDQGKLRLIAKGVRKVKSKLAGGVELFSVSELSYINGRGEIGTLVSSRLVDHYGNIVKSIDRVRLGYDFIKILNKTTEDQPEPMYFELLHQAYIALDDLNIDPEIICYWYKAQLLKFAGHIPNLISDISGEKLKKDTRYNFNVDAMSFSKDPTGDCETDQIQSMRLVFSSNLPGVLNRVQQLSPVLSEMSNLMNSMFEAMLGS